MAVAIQVPGWCKVSVQQLTGDLSSLTELGRTRNGVTISEENFWHDVPGDEFGGDDGPPIDSQYLGTLIRIRCEFTKYDRNVLNTVLGLFRGSTWGLVQSPSATPTHKYPGRLIFSNNDYLRVLLEPALSQTRNYPRCIIRAPHENNLATKYSAPIIEFEAHANPDGSGNYYHHNASAESGFPLGV